MVAPFSVADAAMDASASFQKVLSSTLSVTPKLNPSSCFASKKSEASVRFTLPREARLRRSFQYELVRQSRVIAHGPLLSLALMEQPNSPTQCGIIVSRSVGGATVRNHLKRRLRDLYRHERPTLASGLWLVLNTKPAAATASLANLHSEWARLKNRLETKGYRLTRVCPEVNQF